MRKLLYILPVILILGFAACENYVDITPTGKKTVDSTDTYYELIALPNRAYHPAAFALLSDNVWSKESNIIGNEFISWDGINMTFNEAANRKELCYTYILRSNIVISLVDASLGDKDVKELAKAEAKIMRAWDHFILINTFAKAYNPETAATDGGVAIIDKYENNPFFQQYILDLTFCLLNYVFNYDLDVYEFKVYAYLCMRADCLPLFICSIEIGKKRKKLPKNH